MNGPDHSGKESWKKLLGSLVSSDERTPEY